MASPEAPVGRGEAAQAISNALVRLLRDYTGRGPTQAYTTITDSHVIVVLRDALLKVAAIEENTGREVLAFLSDHHIDPDIAVEVFILKPRGSGEDGDGSSGTAAG